MLGALTPGGSVSATTRVALARAHDVVEFGRNAGDTLAWCVAVGRSAPAIGTGRTRELWELLAGTGALDVSAARMLEPHLDALGILNQAGTDLERDADPWRIADVSADAGSSWGVFAAEAGGARLDARPATSGWTLHGTKPWCSLAADLSHALVTAWVNDSERGLFAVDLRAPRVTAHPGPWHARGLPHVVSAPVEFDGVPAVPIGDPGWYLTRPGFAWGGMAVAACWWGGALGLVDALRAAAESPRADQVALVHLGRVDAALWATRAALAEAADLVDGGGSADVGERLLAARVRSIASDAATLALAESDAALGPAPLVGDEAHARRVADLHLYLRQHHALRDLARIGRDVVDIGGEA